MKYIAITIAVLLHGVAFNAFAGIYDVTLPHVASDREVAFCQTLAEETASAFARQATGATIIDYGCRNTQPGRDTIGVVLTYRAAASLNLVSTDSFSTDSIALYTNRDLCMAQLEHQKAMFESSTGLVPLVAYCKMDPHPGHWLTRVEGIGASAVRPSSVSANFEGNLLDQARLMADYESAAAAFGLTIFEMGVAPAFIGQNLVIRFYGDASYSIEDYDKMIYETPDACMAAADLVRSKLAMHTDKPVAVYCAQKRGVPESTLHATALRRTLADHAFEARVLSRSFSSMAECQIAADEIDNGSEDVFGAFCAGKGTAFSVHLFLRP